MGRAIKTVYIVHHSHTDIGYTDLQERVIENQVDYIRTVLEMMQKPEYSDFRWNCETLYCVEEFWKTADDTQRRLFCNLAKDGKLGLSANYLNFTDLLDCGIYRERLAKWQETFSAYGLQMRTAMAADINGISMGCRDAMLENGVEFLFMNVHCHHGMYPLYQNQKAFWWENAAGKRLLVWNGEHYNLGNVLGIKPNRSANFMMQDRLSRPESSGDDALTLKENLEDYLDSVESQGYAYDFLITAVSGVFSDNAPPSAEILKTIQTYNERYGQEVRLKMVSLQELYQAIAPKLADAPVFRGDFTDWWANGVGSTPYVVKHYKQARHNYALCRRLDGDIASKQPQLYAEAQDNLMLYAEHTWGHSATITDPCDAMVTNLDIRKTSYASKAHEAAARMLGTISREKGDILRYYNISGTIRVCGVNRDNSPQVIEFYIESHIPQAVEIRDAKGNLYPSQVSMHPRGRKISFVDTLTFGEEKIYTYHTVPAQPQVLNTRKCYVGAERIRDIVNDYDPVTYRLPYEFENAYFRLCYRPGDGITSLWDKAKNRELLGEGIPFFTPVYECTALRPELRDCVYEERRLLGRNIRGQHAQLHVGKLLEIVCLEQGSVFTLLRFRFELPGTIQADVLVKLYEALPRIDFRLELGKTLSRDIESIFLPLTLSVPASELYLRKGAESFRPGMDQLPGTCMEYYMSDDGIAYVSREGSALIACWDVPLVYMGQMRHHPIRLCDGLPENNRRPIYSWVMNNTWETNFKMDLSGFSQFDYTLWLSDSADAESAMDTLRERCFDPYVLILE